MQELHIDHSKGSQPSNPDNNQFDICPDLPANQKESLENLLQEFKDVFAFSVFDIKAANFVVASLPLKDPNKITRSRVFRFSPADKQDAHEYVGHSSTKKKSFFVPMFSW